MPEDWLSNVTFRNETHAQLQSWGIYDEYREVHRAYAALIADPESGIEALKRALFLGWYDLGEPACLTGIFDLPAEVLAMLEHTVLREANQSADPGSARPANPGDGPAP